MALLAPDGFVPEARDLLEASSGLDLASTFYLAGSAALNSHIGHLPPLRSLDLMSQHNRLRSAARRDALGELLALDPELQVETARDGYLFVRTRKRVALQLFYYPYPLVDEPDTSCGWQVASLVDLGLMKLGAIISRGRRSDFIDLHLLAQRCPLERLFGNAPRKFERVRDFPLQALKGLADLSLTENDPTPELAKPLAWSEIESWARGTVADLARNELGLR